MLGEVSLSKIRCEDKCTDTSLECDEEDSEPVARPPI